MSDTLNALGSLSANDWIFVVANVVIFSTYGFIAVFIAPLLPVRLPTLVGAFGFFVFCGLTHVDMVFHTLAAQDETWGELVSDSHMLLVHIPQAIFVVVFARGFFRDLAHLRATGRPVSPTAGFDRTLDRMAEAAAEQDERRE